MAVEFEPAALPPPFPPAVNPIEGIKEENITEETINFDVAAWRVELFVSLCQLADHSPST